MELTKAQVIKIISVMMDEVETDHLITHYDDKELVEMIKRTIKNMGKIFEA